MPQAATSELREWLVTAMRGAAAAVWTEAEGPVQREGNRVTVGPLPPAVGDGNGFIRGLETLLAHAGTPVGYDRLMGLSGLAFILQADTEHRWEGNVDAGWWPLDPWGLLLRREFLGRALGWSLPEVGRPVLTAEEAAALGDPAAVYREALEPCVRGLIDAGRPLLSLADFGFVVAGYDTAVAQPPLLGRCGRETTTALGRSPSWPLGLLALGARQTPLDAAAADLAAVRHAVALAADRGGPVDAPWRGRRFTGQRAYAAWSALLRNPAEAVEDRHHANVRANLITCRRAAVAFLREMAQRRGGVAGEALLQAAGAYEAVLARLAVMETGGLAAPAARQALADAVDQVAALELEAARHLADAAVALAVHREPARTWIEGVEGFHPGEYASSVHGSQARVLESLGEALTYADLVCYGGLAFRVAVHQELCPSAGHPCCGFNCVGGSNRALTWRTRCYDSLPWAEPKTDRAAFETEVCAAIRDSIDRGVPVHYGGEEDGLIVGYADAGRRWLCLHPYHEGGRKLFWHDEAKGFAGGTWPWGIVVWTAPTPPAEWADPRELTIAALRQAVAMWRTPQVEAYYCGAEAYARWLAWLRAVEAGQVENLAGWMQGNGWCYDVLVHSRRLAGPWLRRQATAWGGAAGRSLRAAAAEYDAVAAGLAEGLSCTWDLALPPSRVEAWTSALRQEQIRRLAAAREHDQAAIEALEQALAGMG